MFENKFLSSKILFYNYRCKIKKKSEFSFIPNKKSDFSHILKLLFNYLYFILYNTNI